ncbi:hypothetical protein Tco_1224647, partial [Tanacetum coccineum]
YLSETQQENVQNSNSSAQQDVLILSMFDQLRIIPPKTKGSKKKANTDTTTKAKASHSPQRSERKGVWKRKAEDYRVGDYL